ncbi:hypothetical protein [Kineococcus sp. SYSU DK005]|uniref:hypothetical protein n=1 Tax=Kineococcus sp. SYSU DK005 TaxID=3383126 RepID=UPI003D7E923F
MLSDQTRQALRVLRWRGADHLEDAARGLLRRPRPVPAPPTGRPQLSEAQMDQLIEQTVLAPRRVQPQGRSQVQS